MCDLPKPEMGGDPSVRPVRRLEKCARENRFMNQAHIEVRVLIVFAEPENGW